MKEKVVIVDDQDTARMIVQGILTEAGYEVVGQANSIAQALSVIEKKKPHVVISDIMLKNEVGIDLLKEIRERFPKILVVMITGEATKFSLYGVVENGAHAFISKPLNAKKVLSALDNCFKSGKTLKENGVTIEKPEGYDEAEAERAKARAAKIEPEGVEEVKAEDEQGSSEDTPDASDTAENEDKKSEEG